MTAKEITNLILSGAGVLIVVLGGIAYGDLKASNERVATSNEKILEIVADTREDLVRVAGEVITQQVRLDGATFAQAIKDGTQDNELAAHGVRLSRIEDRDE